jgi:O-antigen ligase
MIISPNNTGNFFLGKSWNEFSILEKITVTFVISTPLFYLSIPHWITNVSILGCFLSIAWLISNRKSYELQHIKNVKLMALVFFIYVIAIIVSQLGRQNFVLREYLDQSRWMVGLPFFLFIYSLRINYSKVLDWAAPVCILSAWISSVYVYPSANWGDRATVVHIDPLTFGFMNLSLALMCFASVIFDFKKVKISFNTFLKAIAFLFGIYLSIRSGSRSGWLAFPLVIAGIFYILYKPSKGQALVLLMGVLGLTLIIYHHVPIVNVRIGGMLNELSNYPWTGGMAPDTSVGMRITFYRLGGYYFSQSPLFGWGERGYGEIKNALPLLNFSSQSTRDFAFASLFHSEWTTQAVRFGFLGLFGVFLVFWIPMKFFYELVKSNGNGLKIGCMGLAYMTCQLVASLGDEVFNSKGATTFGAVIISGLLATAFSQENNKQVDR